MWDYNMPEIKGKPRYLAIADYLEQDILSGELAPGTRLLPHRELASKISVPLSAVTRAYALLAKRGLVTSTVGRGTFVLEYKSITQTEDSAKTEIELGMPMLLTDQEPSVKPILQKILQGDHLEALVKTLSPIGHHKHREIGAGWLCRAGVNATADSTLIANGQQHAMCSILSGLFALGEKIAVGQFTTPGITMLMRRVGVEYEAVMVDEYGMIPERLDELCALQDIRGVVSVGNTQNPSARPISPDRQKALREVIAKHKLITIEDGSLNAFNTQTGQAFSSLLPDSSVYFASLAPAIFCSLQVAFIHAPPRLYSRIAQSIMDNILTVPPLNVTIACEAITSGALDKALKNKHEEMKRRIDMFHDILGESVVSCSPDSIYAWLRLPDGWEARDFEYQAGKNGVRVFSADRFMVGAFQPPNCVRLSVTGPADAIALKRGLNILAAMLKKEGGIVPPIW